jgi:uncharacterized membrane protein
MKSVRMRRVTARYQWDRLEVSFWFFPVVMSIGAILLAWVLYWVDSWLPNEILQESRFVLSGTPGEIRTMLITSAGTILATAGVVFTLLTLPLSTVAAQYGSRLLRVFLGDRTTQIVLGTFVAAFVYCVTAALSVLPTNIEADGPQITATVGLLLELASFASLILLVQHISTMLQAPNIAAAAGAELREVVLAEIPEQGERPQEIRNESMVLPDELAQAEGYPIRVKKAGCIQYIDPEYIMTLAQENDLTIRLQCKPGHAVWSDAVVAIVWPPDRVNQDLESQIRNAFRIGNNRTPTQDVAYGVNQLVEMAVRAMSAAINDPFTAMTCLNYIGEGLALFIKQGEKKPNYYDQESKLRLMLEPVTFAELLDGAFNMLRHASCNDASVLLHMLDVIQTISRETNSTKVNQELCRHINLIQEETNAGSIINSDRDRISIRCLEMIGSLQAKTTQDTEEYGLLLATDKNGH